MVRALNSISYSKFRVFLFEEEVFRIPWGPVPLNTRVSGPAVKDLRVGRMHWHRTHLEHL